MYSQNKMYRNHVCCGLFKLPSRLERCTLKYGKVFMEAARNICKGREARQFAKPNFCTFKPFRNLLRIILRLLISTQNHNFYFLKRIRRGDICFLVPSPPKTNQFSVYCGKDIRSIYIRNCEDGGENKRTVLKRILNK